MSGATGFGATPMPPQSTNRMERRDKQFGRTRREVTSSVPLSPAEVDRIAHAAQYRGDVSRIEVLRLVATIRELREQAAA